jgi:hypothetical protein
VHQGPNGSFSANTSQKLANNLAIQIIKTNQGSALANVSSKNQTLAAGMTSNTGGNAAGGMISIADSGPISGGTQTLISGSGAAYGRKANLDTS